jgi:hypothetical protein
MHKLGENSSPMAKERVGVRGAAVTLALFKSIILCCVDNALGMLL